MKNWKNESEWPKVSGIKLRQSYATLNALSSVRESSVLFIVLLRISVKNVPFPNHEPVQFPHILLFNASYRFTYNRLIYIRQVE